MRMPTDRAFAWLQKAEEGKGAFNTQDRLLKPLTNDPRWLLLLEVIGKSPAQLNAIEFGVTLSQLGESQFF
jgi:hypothetical protein